MVSPKVDHHPTRQRAKLTRQQRADLRRVQVDARKAYGFTCPTGFKTFTGACGAQVVAPIYCGRVDCPTCAKRKAAENTERYSPTLASWRAPKLITLTLRSSRDLDAQLDALQDARHRWLDTRIGTRARAALEAAHEQYLNSVVTDRNGHSRPRFNEKDRAQHRTSAHRFFVELEAEEVAYRAQHLRGQFKFRHLFDDGLATLEVTYSHRNGWHAHCHIAVDTERYIPQTVLTVMWLQATRGAGQMVDIRQLRNKGDKPWFSETLKYVAKPGAIPLELSEALHLAMSGRQTIKPLADTKPIDAPIPTCGECGRPTRLPKICPMCHKATDHKKPDHCECQHDVCQRHDAGTLGTRDRVGPGQYLTRADANRPAIVTLTREGKRLSWSRVDITDGMADVLDAKRRAELHIVEEARREIRELHHAIHHPNGAPLAELLQRHAELSAIVLRHANTPMYEQKGAPTDPRKAQGPPAQAFADDEGHEYEMQRW